MRMRALVVGLMLVWTSAAYAQVESRSGARVELSGLILMNGFFTENWASNTDLPRYAIPITPGEPGQNSLGGTARQSRLTLIGFYPDVLGGDVIGEVDVDFWGGQIAGGRVNPLLRIRRVRADLRWRNAWIMFGQEAPPITGPNPSSVAAIGIPEFSYAGNLWIWLPQVRVGAISSGTLRLGVEGSVLAPRSGDDVGAFVTTPDRAERTQRPFVEARALVRWGNPDAPDEVSIGGHYGWLYNNADSLLISRAVALAAQFAVTDYVEIRGEAFVGQALSVLGAGGIGQNIGPAGQSVRTKGGWGQINVLPTPDWEIGGGGGMDDPDNADVDPTTGRQRNLVLEGHAIWRPRPLVFGVTYRRHETLYGGANIGKRVSNHVNLAFGFEF